MGDEADRLSDWYGPEYDDREHQQARIDDEAREMSDRFSTNARAEVGATIKCACCSRLVVKRSYQQKFCPPKLKGKRKTYPCKDRYWNVVNPRGKFAHLAG